jgi:hypothetical protein
MSTGALAGRATSSPCFRFEAPLLPVAGLPFNWIVVCGEPTCDGELFLETTAAPADFSSEIDEGVVGEERREALKSRGCQHDPQHPPRVR